MRTSSINPIGLGASVVLVAVVVIVGMRLEASSISVIAATIAGFLAGALITALLFTFLSGRRTTSTTPSAPPGAAPQWVVMPPMTWPHNAPQQPQISIQSLPYPAWEQPRRRFTVIGDDGSINDLEPDA